MKIYTSIFYLAAFAALVFLSILPLGAIPELVKEKKSEHFSVIYPSSYEKYAHIVLQIAEEEYVRSSDYTSFVLVRPLSIFIIPPKEGLKREFYYSENRFYYKDEDSLYIDLGSDYSRLRMDVSRKTARALLHQAARYTVRGETLVHEGLRDQNDFIEGYTRYIAQGFSPDDSYYLKRHLQAKLSVRVPVFHSGSSQDFLSTAFFHYLETKYGKEKLRNLCARMNLPGSYLNAYISVYGLTRSRLLAQCSAYYRSLFRIRSPKSSEGFLVQPEASGTIEYRDETAHIKSGRKSLAVRPLYSSPSQLARRRVSYTSGQNLFVYARKNGSGSSIVFLSGSGNEKESIYFPFQKITTPSLSEDGKLLIFSGHTNRACDLYLYTRETRELRRLTHNLFIESDAVFGPGPNEFVFITNYNVNNYYDSRAYMLRKGNLDTGAIIDLTDSTEGCMHPAVGPEGEVIAVFHVDTAFRICMVDAQNKTIVPLTAPDEDAFFPSVQGSSVLYASFKDGVYSKKRTDSFSENPPVKLASNDEARASLVDYSTISSSTYRNDLLSVQSKTGIKNDSSSALYAGFKSNLTWNEKILAVFALDHAVNREDFSDAGVYSGISYLFERFGASLEYYRRFFPAYSSYGHSVILPSDLDYTIATHHGASLSAYAYITDSTVVHSGLRYNRYHSDTEFISANVEAFAAVQFGDTYDDALFSEGRFLILKSSYLAGDDSASLTEAAYSFSQALPLALYFSSEGGLSYLGGSSFYQPSGSHLSAYSGAAQKSTASVYSKSSMYVIPFVNLSYRRISTGPLGLGIFSGYSYILKEHELNEEKSFLYDTGLSFKSGIPGKYFLKLDCLLPFLYGYNSSTILLFSTGITF